MSTIDRDELRKLAVKANHPDANMRDTEAFRNACTHPRHTLALLDQIDQAEARIKAVEDALDQPADDTEGMDSTSAHYANGYEIALQDIRRALDGDA